MTLTGLSSKLRDSIRWSEANRVSLQERYAGWRIIEIKRKQGSDSSPLPPAAVPPVVVRALATGRAIFEVVVTPYLDLGRMTLDQVMQMQDLDSYLFA